MTSPLNSNSNSKRRCLQTLTLTPASSLDPLLLSALALPDPSIPIGLSLERILSAHELPGDKAALLAGAARVASSLLEAAARSGRKLAAAHNAAVWPLTADLTVKVFSMLDSESVCFAAAACSLFSRCASESLCYAHIDLTRSVGKVTNTVVSTMIQRAGKNLQSIKLGRLPQGKDRLDEDVDEDEDESPLTGSCLAALTLDGGAAGLLVKKLHLYNLKMNDYDPCAALSVCRSLSELEIVGMDICYESVLRTIIKHCHSIEHLCFDTGGMYINSIEDLTKTCHLLSSLSLRGFGVADDTLSVLIKGARSLRYLDLSRSFGFSGSFLRDLRDNGGTDSLETLILCDCMNLRAIEVSLFLSAASLFGGWKALRYVDISNRKGLLAHRGPSGSCTRCAIEVAPFIQGRPGIHLIADYPPEMCIYGDYTNWPSSFSNNDSGSPSSSALLSGSLSEESTSDDDTDNSL